MKKLNRNIKENTNDEDQPIEGAEGEQPEETPEEIKVPWYKNRKKLVWAGIGAGAFATALTIFSDYIRHRGEKYEEYEDYEPEDEVDEDDESEETDAPEETD